MIKISIKFIAVVIFLFVTAEISFSKGKNTNVIFIHHSVGHSLIRDGSVRQIFKEAGFQFWDHGYNDSKSGLRNGNGEEAGCYWIPDNNTNPDGFNNIFSMDPKGENTFSKLLANHDIICFKSCFPNSKILEDNFAKDIINTKRRSLANFKKHYLKIRSTIAEHPEKKFVIITQPPLISKYTTMEEAARARSFVDWLESDEYLGNLTNLFVFNYFDMLADKKTNLLRPEYLININEPNAHPNPIANMLIGPIYIDFIYNMNHSKKIMNLPEIKFLKSKSDNHFKKSLGNTITLKGTVTSAQPLKRLYWTDLKGNSGDLPIKSSWIIHELELEHGVTKVIVTAEDMWSNRSSSIIGIKYYPNKRIEKSIFDESINAIDISGLSLSKTLPYAGKSHLVINGDGNYKRGAINNVDMDISTFDPEKTYLELYYDQGKNKTRPKFIMPGIGMLSVDVDDKEGYEKICIPFSSFNYVTNIMEKLIIKGNWADKSKVLLDSIKLVSSDNNQ